MSDKIGLLTGSFDPVTLGHLDIIERASKLFDQLYVGIFYNKEKQGFFSIEERKHMLEEAVAELDNVRVVTAHNSLAVDIARKLGATYLVRGLRNATDFDYEANLEFFNKGLADDLETVYLIASHGQQPVSSSRVRELIHFGADLSPYAPDSVIKEVEKKFGRQETI
ncbi:pantetheine-phosphate adenylyltransferase [Streptococcus loxodontisalivarius]|uniref:Phosphopantetheine adenylyltransferase n=1 Tax=Streptococcus loxodontisalivarius TaxID=1349415 RepID=A0ABS2PUC2_9STRE|nr:pantetheine-phosphate adenylyltransferase [Streptococcus loxodontisalivarius]MBM7643610.1 pantetheine-phosphate adenylyltransferase [Streptococcus loxodontisalivarius]